MVAADSGRSWTAFISRFSSMAWGLCSPSRNAFHYGEYWSWFVIGESAFNCCFSFPCSLHETWCFCSSINMLQCFWLLNGIFHQVGSFPILHPCWTWKEIPSNQSHFSVWIRLQQDFYQPIISFHLLLHTKIDSLFLIWQAHMIWQHQALFMHLFVFLYSPP